MVSVQKTEDVTIFYSHASLTYKTTREKTRTMATVIMIITMTMCH
jgi:hypothetical protein